MIMKRDTTDAITKAPSATMTSSSSLSSTAAYRDALWKEVDILRWLSEDMGIRQDVLEKYHVGSAVYKSQDEQAKEAKCVTFPRTGPDYGPATTDTDTPYQTVRIKACLPHDYGDLHAFDPVTPSAAEPGLFGYHVAPINASSVVLCHDEFDALAVYQSTGVPAMSLPESYYQLTPDVVSLLERFNQIYLWMPDDVHGQEASATFAQKLGLERCLLVATRSADPDGPTRPHDAMMAGRNLLDVLTRAKPLGHEQILDFNLLRDAVHRELANPDQLAGVQSIDFPQLNEILKGHRRGELSIWTGPTGIGKTTTLSQLSLDLCRHGGVSTLWGSFEIPLTRFTSRMMKQFADKDLSQHVHEFQTWADRFEQLPMYFLKYFGSTDVEELIGVLSHAHHVYDIQHIVIDNLQFMLSGQGAALEKWDIQDRVISALRSFATTKNVHISLVVHPRKDSRERLDLLSVFGSAKVTQEADNVIIVQDMGNGVRMIDVKKNRFDGTLGGVLCRFDKATLKLHPLNVEELVQNGYVKQQAVAAASL